jgi:hypothetical protein
MLFEELRNAGLSSGFFTQEELNNVVSRASRSNDLRTALKDLIAQARSDIDGFLEKSVADLPVAFDISRLSSEDYNEILENAKYDIVQGMSRKDALTKALNKLF